MKFKIGDRLVGDGCPCYVVAEIGINHNGSLETAAEMINAAAAAGADAVKFQKRTVDVVYTEEELARPRESPFGDTNGDLKRGLEFYRPHYVRINSLVHAHGLDWFASPWDRESVSFLAEFDPPVWKVASACLTDSQLVADIASMGKPVLLSTGMSSLEEIDRAVAICHEYTPDIILMQCTSTYPCQDQHINLRAMATLRDRYGCLVGYSGHERGLATTVAAVALGACVVERHFTLDRSMWGSDQAASIEPHALKHLVRDIRAVEAALGSPEKCRLAAEEPVMRKLRRVMA